MGTVVSMDGTSIAFDRYGQGPPIVLVGGRSSTGRSTRGRQNWRSCCRRTSRCFTTTGGAAATVATRRHTRCTVRSRTSTPSSRRLAGRRPFSACPPARPCPGGGSSRHCHQKARAVRGAIYRGRQSFSVPRGLSAAPEHAPGAGPARRCGQVLAAARRCPRPCHGPDALHARVAEVQGGRAHPPVRRRSPRRHHGRCPVAGRAVGWDHATVLTIVGGKSPDWLHHGGQALADVLPNAEHRTLDGQTHMVKSKALAPMLTSSSPADDGDSAPQAGRRTGDRSARAS